MKLGAAAGIARGSLWLTPRYEKFIQFQRNVDAERDALVRIMTRPPRVRTNTFSASGAGRCLRERQLSYLGVSKKRPDAKSMNIFANGDYVHLRHQVAGFVGEYLAEAEYSVARPEDNLTGTLDGVTTDGDGAEFKSINSRGFKDVNTFGIKPDHKEQTHSYMLAGGFTTFWVLYENKDTNELREFRLNRDPELIDKVQRDLDTLNEATDEKRLLPMLPECVAGEGRFKRCDFRETCPMAQFLPKEEVAPSRSRLRIRAASSTPTD